MKFSVCDESSKPQPPAWWSKLFRGEHGGIGLRPSSAVLKKFESTCTEETAGSTAPPSRSSSWSMADSSSDAGNERHQQPNLKRIRQHVDLLQAAVKVSKGDDADPSDLPAFPNLPPSEGAKPFALTKAQSSPTKAKKADRKDDQQQRQRRLSRSPVLPVSRPWDPSYSPDAVAAGATSSRDSSPNNNNSNASSSSAPARRPYRHRYELGPLCCPACDEAARAEAEEAYARATWRMYDRITRARAAAAARRARLIEAAEEEDARAQQQQQQTQHRQEMVCLPIAPAAGEVLPQSTRRMPLPSRFEKSPFPSLPSLYHDNDDERNNYTNNEDFERDDDAHGAVFTLDLDQ